MSDEPKRRRDIMERKKKIIVAVAAVLVLIVGLMAWKKSEIKLSGRYKTDQSTQYIYMLPDEFVFENGYCDIGSFTCTYEYKNGNSQSSNSSVIIERTNTGRIRWTPELKAKFVEDSTILSEKTMMNLYGLKQSTYRTTLSKIKQELKLQVILMKQYRKKVSDY